MSVTGRLDFTDLDSPQAIPPAARAERAHRTALRSVHGELRSHANVYVTPERTPRRPRSTSRTSPDESTKSSHSTHSTRMSDADMVAMLRARLGDAMELIELQQKMIRESMTDAAVDEAREQQLDEIRRSRWKRSSSKMLRTSPRTALATRIR
ncbi:hypothetical protein PF010_g26569 [Phytophthora fragariae]|uniref:Uncharacterized protein n=1 Tax=Phytophthora fragariae TaxID=53985 RepID=A0A6G0JXD6_9STRA|nr:hypothetical protein PF010_g26569 [Phytophthora fragariae]